MGEGMKDSIISFDYMHLDTVIARVELLKDNKTVVVTNYTDRFIDKPFGLLENITIKDLNHFFETRCFPSTRFNAKEVLKAGNIDYFDALQIIRKTNGAMVDDCYWIRFEGDSFTWESVNPMRF